MNRDWKDAEHCHYYYNVENGKIVGQSHNVAHTKIWVAMVKLNHNEEQYLGQYITLDFAKRAVELYWEIQERTLLSFDREIDNGNV